MSLITMVPRMDDAPLPALAVVEDDDELREGVLLPILRRSGFDAEGMPDARALYRAMTVRRFDLVLLDIGLPDESGLSVASHLRLASPDTGIIVLSGHRRSSDKVRGLQAGADVYLEKPVEMEVVTASLHGLLQRLRTTREVASMAGRWRLGETQWTLVAPDGTSIVLTLPEWQFLGLLAASAGRPVTRDSLVAGLGGDEQGMDAHRLDMLVYRLRRKCAESTSTPLPLRAVRGIGYVLSW